MLLGFFSFLNIDNLNIDNFKNLFVFKFQCDNEKLIR